MYPTLARMARDVFACQATSAASEREFNGAVDILGIRRQHMSVTTLQQLKETQAMLKDEHEIVIV